MSYYWGLGPNPNLEPKNLNPNPEYNKHNHAFGSSTLISSYHNHVFGSPSLIFKFGNRFPVSLMRKT